MPVHNNKTALALAIAEMLTREELEDLHARLKAAKPPVDWAKERRTCSRCGHEGPVDPDFGLRTDRGRKAPQSWCTSCRAKTSAEYRRAPRKNLTRK